MQLEVKLPELNERSFDTAKGTKLVLDYMYQLNRQLKYVLNNLEEENLSQEITDKLSSVDGLKDEIKDAVRQDAYYANNIIVNNSIGQIGKDVAIQAQTILLQGQKIDLNTINISQNTSKIQATELRMDGAEVTLTAQQLELTNQGSRLSSAELRLDGAEAEIELKVSKNGVIAAINLTTEAATIQAAKINLEGYVTASQLSAEIANINNQWSSKVSTYSLEVTGDFSYRGYSISRRSRSVVTGLPSFLTAKVNNTAGNEISVVTGFADAPDRVTLYYLGDSL